MIHGLTFQWGFAQNLLLMLLWVFVMCFLIEIEDATS